MAMGGPPFNAPNHTLTLLRRNLTSRPTYFDASSLLFKASLPPLAPPHCPLLLIAKQNASSPKKSTFLAIRC